MPPIDILYVGTLPPHPGGSGVVAGQVLPRVAARGHRVRAVSPTGHPAVQRELADRVDLPGVETYRYGLPVDRVDALAITLEIVRAERRPLRDAFRRALAAGCPDLLVSGRENYAIHVAVLAQALGVPFVQVHHARDAGGLFDMTQPRRALRLRHRMARARRLLLVAHHLWELVADLGVPATVVPNAVETDRFRPMVRDPAFAARWGIPADALVVMHPSNLKAVKRATDLVHAAPAVLARVPSARFVVVGDGPQRPDLERAIRGSGLADRFTVTGWQERATMPDWYALSDIVVLASSTEAMPLAALETLASGRVLVVSDIAASRELIRDGEDGLLFPVGDIAALADRIVAAATDPVLRRRVGTAARTTAVGRDIESSVVGWETVLADAAVAGLRGAGASVTRPGVG